ncbi:MAG: hypothetical protein ACRENK_08975 [Gemmatimonadaceae bacterium]
MLGTLGVGVLVQIAALIAVVAAIILFVRVRSMAAGLLLVGIVVMAAAPIINFFLASIAKGHTSVAVLFVAVLGPLCSSAGLLWHALTIPKRVVSVKSS